MSSASLFAARPVPLRSRARSAARPSSARRRDLDYFLDNDARDDLSKSASARHHVQRVDARIADLKRALRAAEAERLDEALRCLAAEEEATRHLELSLPETLYNM